MKKLNEKEIFEFSIAFSLVFILLFLFKGFTLFIYISIFLLAGTLFFKKVNLLLFSYLTIIGSKIGTVLSKIFLTVAYYLVLLPTAILYKKTTDIEKTPFFKNKKRDSYFIDRKKQISPEDFEKMW